MYLKPNKNLFQDIFLLGCIFIFGYLHPLQAQIADNLHDTIHVITYDTISGNDLTPFNNDSIANDTLFAKIKKPKTVLESIVDYNAEDSIITDIASQKVYLYKNAVIVYGDIELKAAYIEFNMADQSVYAMGMPDSSGKMAGYPDFKQGSENFQAHSLTYSFKSKKGIIQDIKSEQDGGYLHSEITKRHPNGEIHLKNGKYTTCDADHPHFYLALTKGIVVPEDKIVSGPAYVVIEDVPLKFIGIPFGFFPNTKTSTSGILIPSYGEELVRGFNLRGGGYYFAISDYMDLRLTGDIYSRGTWGLNATTNYVKRYKFSGSLSGRYFENVTGEKDLPNYNRSKDFSIIWSHAQDSKANPNQRFSASVDFSSSSYDRNHSYDLDRYLSSTKRSSVAFSKSFPGKPFNFSSSLNINQNSQTQKVDMTLPNMSFSMNTIYPFKRKDATGKNKWYENIQLSYNSALQNNIYTTDSMLFKDGMFDNIKNGYRHSIPLSTNFKFLNFFNLSPSISYNGVLYTNSINKRYDATYYDAKLDSVYPKVLIDTIPGLKYAHAAVPSISLSATPRIYGMYQMKNPNSRIIAIRHVMSPTASLSFTPDISRIMPDYYRSYQKDTTGKMAEYSIFEGSLYGTPMASGRSGGLSLSLRNTLEMKVRETNADTAKVKDKKIKLLENFDFSTSYSPFKDSLKWAPVNFTTGTRILNGNLNIRWAAQFDMYALAEDKKARVNRYYWRVRPGKLLRFVSSNVNMSTRFQSKAGGKKTDKNEPSLPGRNPQAMDETMPGNDQNGYFADYVDFDVPWSINLDYNYDYRVSTGKPETTQSMRVNGDISLTKKWKIGASSGYDFTAKEVTITSINIYRDLHCWEMRFTVVPFGQRQSYNFNINVKSALLQDLKYEKRKSWYDKL